MSDKVPAKKKESSLLGSSLQISSEELGQTKKHALGRISENERLDIAHSLARVSAKVFTVDGLSARHPGLDLSLALGDPELMRQSESIANRADFKACCDDVRLRTTRRKAIEVLERTLDDPNCTPAQAVSIGDSLVKIQTAMESESAPPTLQRHLSIYLGSASVETPVSSFSVRITTVGDLVDVVNAMCCTSESQIDAVIDALKESAAGSFIAGGVTLGW